MAAAQKRYYSVQLIDGFNAEDMPNVEKVQAGYISANVLVTKSVIRPFSVP